MDWRPLDTFASPADPTPPIAFGALDLIPSFAISAPVASPEPASAPGPPPPRPCWQAPAQASRFALEDALEANGARGSPRDGTMGTERHAQRTVTRYERGLKSDVEWVTYTSCSHEKGAQNG